ncbi:MAG TPA: hypothetical protein VFD92_20035 [Candidatus Binatia bacterium]|nr:hypothetical protein [Candidatus Binatia bacterium]
MPMPGRHRRFSLAGPVLALVLVACRPACAFDVVLNAQGEFLDAYLVNGTPYPPKVVFIDPDPANPDSLGVPPRVGRHVNGKLCFFPRGVGHNGQFVIADDTYREACVDRDPPQARCSVAARGNRFYVGRDSDGWGLFGSNGRWRKRVVQVPGTFDPPVQGAIDPQGCFFDARGSLFLTDVGSGDPLARDGSLLVFFPGPRHRYDTFCFLDKGLAQPGMPAADAAGNLYVPEPGAGRVSKFGPPFPASEADCANPDHLVAVAPTKSLYPTPGSGTPAGIVAVPGTDHFYVSSVLAPAAIDEYDANGVLVRNIVPPGVALNPLGMDVGSDGTLYFAELNLNPDTSTGCGRVSMVRFVAGMPQPPEVLGKNLSFPDGVTVVDSSQLRVSWTRLPPAPEPDPRTCGGE